MCTQTPDELTKARDALAMAREQLRVVDNAVEHAMISMDLERSVLSWNPGAELLTGFTKEEILGKSADSIFTPEDRAQFAPLQETQTALMKGRAADERWHVRKDHSKFWGSGVMLPMKDKEGGEAIGFLKIFRDETGRKQAEEALKLALLDTERARADAESANKAKDRILAVISHELRTPLTPVVLAVQILARQSDLSPQVQEMVASIRKNVQIEAHFIDELLDVSRITHGKLELVWEQVDVRAAVESAIMVCSPDLQAKNQELIVTLRAGNHLIEGDSKRIQQVAWNLIKNASKFTPSEGKIFVETNNRNGGIELIVRDTGTGIRREDVGCVFDTFVQVHKDVQPENSGLGLGLSIAKGVVEAHRGTIVAESPGLQQGATFIVWLPFQSPRVETAPKGPES